MHLPGALANAGMKPLLFECKSIDTLSKTFTVSFPRLVKFIIVLDQQHCKVYQKAALERVHS